MTKNSSSKNNMPKKNNLKNKKNLDKKNQVKNITKKSKSIKPIDPNLLSTEFGRKSFNEYNDYYMNALMASKKQFGHSFFSSIKEKNRDWNSKKHDELLKQKQEFKNLSKEKRKMLKIEAKEVNKLNKPHNGPKQKTFDNPLNIIELKDVTKKYTNGYTISNVLKGVNLEIRRGDFVIILGPSGSGKTTLMNIISGLDRATNGITNVCGYNLINFKDDELTSFRKENIGYVFQQYGLLPNLTVKENVEIGADLQADKSKRMNVDKILESFEMLEHKNKFPHQLSGGQQQRVSIARAFAKNPNILFGDEPTGAIDEEMSKLVMKEFVNINKNHGTTVIIVTHNPIFEGLGTLVVKFKDGVVSQMYRNENPKPVDELPWGQE